jgi:hypothetical protein
LNKKVALQVLVKTIYPIKVLGKQLNRWFNMNKKTIYIIVAVLLVVIIAASAVTLLLNNNPNSPKQTTAVNIADATILQFTVNDTSQGTTTPYQFAGINIGTANLTIRVDLPSCNPGGANYTYVLNAGTKSAWNTTSAGAWMTDNFNNAWPLWGNMWSGYVSKLDAWNSTATYSYTASSGDSITIIDIHVNPTIPNSNFQTS